MPIAGVGYAPNTVSEYQAFVDDINGALQRVGSTKSIILLGDFIVRIVTNNKTWKSVIGKDGYPAKN